MNGTGPAQDSQPTRRPFAAPKQNKPWGIGLSIFGALSLLSALYSLVDLISGEPASNPLVMIVVGGACLGTGIYLLRGPGDGTKAKRRQPAGGQNPASVPAASIEQASAALAAATAGGPALVAYRNLDATVRQLAPQSPDATLEAELARIGFDSSSIGSERLGYVASLEGGSVEVFRDYVVLGQRAHNFDAATHGDVFTGGSIQMSTIIKDRDGRKKVSQRENDMRTAQFQLASADWSLSTPIHPDQANEARALLGRLTAHFKSGAGKPVTRSDIREMVDAILANTSQPAADRIRQLDALRYERLLSDDEFAQAKNSILDL